MRSATELTLKALRADGWEVQVVEQWIRRGNMRHGIRRDLFGFIDLVGVRVGDMGVLGVQATTRSGHSKRVRKILEEPRARVWLMGGNRIEVWSWNRSNPSAGPRVQEVTLGDFPRVDE